MSSKASDSQTSDQTSAVTLRPSREHILGGIIMFLICLMFTGYKVAWFFWVPLVPLFFILWTLRVRTLVGPRGIEAKYFFRRSRSVPWDDFKSIRFNKGGRAFAAANDDTQFWLPGVTFNSLVTLNKASQGRIPDPVTPGRAAAQDKVQVVHKDGYAVLMDKDEYADYEAQRRREAGDSAQEPGEH
ncbi:MAG TPA: PH domain-containing protein [Candidatus Corynebacterium gallistercoris]|uniref:PH domain-containing protein n=1 Tax=Candidatus Corynebacterium gallistercoris TaxID=2838530 RepID=A0A9D1RX45_9CORY|nr:PH domain-containing protein [Candidatus Corynebacterium gallistercoris]